MDWPIISNNPDTQKFYQRMRQEGQSHSFAELAALQQFPGVLGTDSQFWAGRWEDIQNEDTVQEYARDAEKAGVSVKGKVYQSGLARFAGDPQAFVSDQHDILAVAKKEGIKTRGCVNYTPPEGVWDPGPPAEEATK